MGVWQDWYRSEYCWSLCERRGVSECVCERERRGGSLSLIDVKRGRKKVKGRKKKKKEKREERREKRERERDARGR